MTFELLRPLWVAPMNFLGDCVRRVLGVGPEWKMHQRLARRLVDRGSWFMIPLTSGTQSPIFDAIDYLVKHRDRESVPRLERLFERYTKSISTLYQERLHGGTVTYVYGPQNYMPLNVQLAAARGLLALLPHFKAKLFVARMLAVEHLGHLDERTIREFLAFAVSTRTEIGEDLIANALHYVSRTVEDEKRRNDAILRR